MFVNISEPVLILHPFRTKDPQLFLKYFWSVVTY